jgi:hypothetical protein
MVKISGLSVCIENRASHYVLVYRLFVVQAPQRRVPNVMNLTSGQKLTNMLPYLPLSCGTS